MRKVTIGEFYKLTVLKSERAFTKVYLYKQVKNIYETLKYQVYKGDSNCFINVYF
ncbi:hypothetical protein EMIT040CA3_60016 [Bacillus pseudomycoides]